MKVTNQDIFDAPKALALLVDYVWPIKTAYWLAKLQRKVTEHWRDVEAPRQALVKRYGTPTENGLKVEPGDPNWEAFYEGYTELMSMEVEIPLDRITLPTKNGKDGEKYEIKGAILTPLVPFLDIEDEASADAKAQID